MTFLVIVVGLFIFVWSRNRKAAQARKAARYNSFVNTMNSYSRPSNLYTNQVRPPITPKSDVAKDVALGVGAALAGAAVYEAFRHEESDNNSSSDDYDPGSFNNTSEDYDSSPSSTGFDGGDSDGGGSSGDW